jgi:hypothetical protein
VVSDEHAGDPPLSQAVASPSAVGADARPGHDRPSALRAAVNARLEELPFSRGVVLMVTAGLVLVVLVIGTATALTAGGTGPKEPRSAAPPPSAPPSASPRATGHSTRAGAPQRRPRTSSSTVVGSAPPPATGSPPVRPSPTPSGPPTYWLPHGGRPHWNSTSPPPWWRHR